MKTNYSTTELKAMAREELLGKYTTAMGIYFVFTFFLMSVSILSNYTIDVNTTYGMIMNNVISFIISLISSVFSVGICHFYLNIGRSREYHFTDLFYSFKHHPDKAIIICFLIYIVTLLVFAPAIICYVLFALKHLIIFFLLGTLFLLISIFVLFRYLLLFALSYYILADFPDLSCREILLKSSELMTGNRLRYIYLQISFLGFILLGFLSCGIAFLWIYPYMYATNALFYLDLLGELTNSSPYSNLYES